PECPRIDDLIPIYCCRRAVAVGLDPPHIVEAARVHRLRARITELGQRESNVIRRDRTAVVPRCFGVEEEGVPPPVWRDLPALSEARDDISIWDLSGETREDHFAVNDRV